MGNTCTNCNCNNDNEPSELLTVDNNKVFSYSFKNVPHLYSK